MHVHHAISYILYTLHGTDGDPAASAVMKRKQRVHASGLAPIHTSLIAYQIHMYNFIISMTEDME